MPTDVIRHGRYIGYDDRLTKQEKIWNFTNLLNKIRSKKINAD